ncbi:hypothetical protein HQ585_16420, partial [candidate division KSB1 bacterium]|nr:hypothetical protein [candidate division KSB1 bacterium]
MKTIPVSIPWVDEDEIRELEEVVKSNYFTENKKTADFENAIRSFTKAK